MKRSALGARGLELLISSQPDKPSPAVSAPLNRIGEVVVKSPLAGNTKTYAVGHGTLYFLVDEAGDMDAFGNPRAQVVEFDSLCAADLVQTIGELCEQAREQEKVIGELKERERLGRSTKLGK